MDVVPQLTLHSSVDEGGVPDRVGVALEEGRIEIVTVCYPVPYTSVKFGDSNLQQRFLEK